MDIILFIFGFIIFAIFIGSITRVILIERKINKLYKEKEFRINQEKNRGGLTSVFERKINKIEQEFQFQIEKLERKRRFILEKLPFIKR